MAPFIWMTCNMKSGLLERYLHLILVHISITIAL